MKKFWKWKTVLNKKPEETTEGTPEGTTEGVNEETGGEVHEGSPEGHPERTLFLTGVIAEESWFDDEVTPEEFKNELESGEGDITVWINSPGGDCIAAARIYNMLTEYSLNKGSVTVKIDGLAASAASVIAMAGTKVFMSPVSMLMIHNPMTFTAGDSDEMRRAAEMLNEVKESIINAYEKKTGLSRTKLAHFMDAETWMNANRAKELGFADEVLYLENDEAEEGAGVSVAYSRAAVTNSLMEKISKACKIEKAKVEVETGAGMETAKPTVSRKKAKATAAVVAETSTKEAEVTVEPTGRKVDDLQARLDLIRRFI